ncbi:MAG: dTDP-4-dehydrorhamnose reductase [Minisyncoccales bacterium]
MKKILIFGSQGMLGMDLFEILQEDYEIIPFSRFNLDLSEVEKIIPTIEKFKPDIVINAAAWTDTEKAENKKFQDTVTLINAIAPREMAKACDKINAHLIHYSTDFVFDGEDEKFYTEDEEKKPINFYGLSKAHGEDFVQNNCSNYSIIRLSWLFGKNGPSFVKKMLQLGNHEKRIDVVNDITISISHSKDVAKYTKKLIDERLDKNKNIFHFVNEGAFTLYDLTKLIFEIKEKTIELNPVSHDIFENIVKRPRHAVLLNTRFEKLPAAENALGDFID